eukprot:scaffold18282_cov79-Phaeocystis_antarctica.AAC.2
MQYSTSTPCPSFAASSGRYPATSPRTCAPAFRWKRSPRSLPFSTCSANDCSLSAVHSRQRVTPHTLCTPSCAWRSTKERSTPPRLPALGSATTPSSCVTAPRGVCSVASVCRTALRSTWMAKESRNRRLGPGATEHRYSLSMALVRALRSGSESSLGQAHLQGGHALRVHGGKQRAVATKGNKLAARLEIEPLPQRRLGRAQERRIPLRLQLEQLRQVRERREPKTRARRGHEALQRDARVRRALRVAQLVRVGQQARVRQRKLPVRRWHQHLARPRLQRIKVERRRFGYELSGVRHRQRVHLEEQQPVPTRHRCPTSHLGELRVRGRARGRARGRLQALGSRAAAHMLDQVAVRQRARQHGAVGTHVRRVALALERRRADATVGRLEVWAVVVHERAHVQDVVLAARSEARAQPLVDGLWVADVAEHRLKRHVGLAQRLRRRHERRLVEVDAYHQQRPLLEPQQKRAIAAPSVRHNRRLLVEGQLVKGVVHVHAHHVVEELAVHEA